MAKYSSSVHYSITTSLDKTGITALYSELNKLKREFAEIQEARLWDSTKTNTAIKEVERIESAIKKAFNPRLGMMNTSTFINEITKGGNSLATSLEKLGGKGVPLLTQVQTQMTKINTGAKQTTKTFDKLFNTIGNTVRWGIIASGFQTMMNSAHSAVTYMKDLDKSLTNIRLVSEESKESMREFARYANEAAKGLGSTTVDYTDAALIYAQQGYNLSDQKVLADYTIKTANATGQDTAEVSEQMTSLINGFQLSVEDVGGALDVMAKVANTSAADLEELATATSKVASTANTLGVTQEQLTAQIATIVSVTRDAPENVGNALKTIYARFGDLSLGETLDDGTSLGKVSSTLEKIGVQVLEDNGAMRDMGAIFEDLMEVWGSLDTADKQATAVTIAGKYQYNRLMALMENQEMYEGYYDDALTSEGTLDTMQSKYMESLEGKTKALKASVEELMTSLVDQDDFGGIIEGLTSLVSLFTDLTDAIGGGSAALTAFGAIAAQTFSNQIGRSLSNVITNREKENLKKSNINVVQERSKQVLFEGGSKTGNANFDQFVNDTSAISQYAGIMSEDQIAQTNTFIDNYSQAVLRAEEADKNLKAQLTALQLAFDMAGVSVNESNDALLLFLQRVEANDAAMDEYYEDVQRWRSSLDGVLSSTSLFIDFLEELYATADVSDDSFLHIATSAEKLQQALKTLAPALKQIGFSEQDLEKFSEALAAAIDLDIEQFKELAQQLRPTQARLEEVSSQLKGINEKNFRSSSLEKNINESNSASGEVAGYHDQAGGQEKGLKTQEAIGSITKAAGAVTSLAFAWQSFQSLGSLWANSDLSLGEKVLQTVLNLSMALPMLLTAMVELAEASKTLRDTTKASNTLEAIRLTLIKLLTVEQTVNTAAQDANTDSRRKNKDAIEEQKLAEQQHAGSLAKEAAAGKLSEAAMGRLKNVAGKAFSALKNIPKGASLAAGAIAILSIAYGAYKKQVEQSKEAAISASEESKEAYASLQESKASFDEVYEKYKEGQASSSDIQEAANNLNKTLDDQSAKLQAAAGNWDLYNQQVERAIENEKEALKEDLSRSTNRKKGIDIVGKDNADYVLNGLMVSSVSDGAKSAVETIKGTTSVLNRLPGGVYSVNANASVQDVIKDVEKAYLILEEREKAVRDNQNLSTETRERYIADLQREKEALDQLRTEDYVAQQEDMEQLASLSSGDVVAGLDSNASAEDIKAAFNNNENIKQYLDTIPDSKEQMDWILSQLTDPTMIQTMQLDSGMSTFSQQLQDAFNAEIAAGTSQDQLLDPEVLASQLNDALSSVPDDKKLDILSFLTSSDKSGSDLLEWIQSILDQLSGELDLSAIIGREQALNPQLNEYGTAVESTVTAEESSGIREKIGISEEAYNVYEQDFTSVIDARREYNNTGRTSIEIANDLAEAEKELAECTDETSQEYKDAQKRVEKLQKEQADYNQELHDTAIRELETQKGLEKLAEAYDDFANADTDVAAAEAMVEMQDALSMVLNTEKQFINSDFIQDHFDDVKAAAEGDIDAIERLRIALAKDMVANIQLNVPEGELVSKRAQIVAWIDELNAMQIEPGASIDDTAFIDGLNHMLWAGEITTTEINALLESLGYDPNIDYKEVKVPVLGWDENGVPSREYETKLMPVVTANKRAYGSGYSTPKSSKGSGGGGGGGGGGSSYEPKTQDLIEDEPDRYEEVNAHLDRLSNSLEMIADEQERLTGKALLDNMQAQVDLIQEQVDWEQKKLEIQRQEAAELQQELSGYGVTFDDEGYMTNYFQTHQKLIDEVNAAINAYNAETTESGQEAAQERIDAAQKKLDDFNETRERYDELTNNEIKETLKALEDYEDEIEDLRIAAFQAAVEAAENIKDVKDAWADFTGFMSGLHIDSPFRALIEDAAKYENSIELVAAKTKDLEDLLQWKDQYAEGGTITDDNPFGKNSAAYYEELQKAYESYIEAVLDAESAYNDQIEDIIDGYDDIADRIEERMEDYSNIIDQLDHYASVIETLYGDQDYDNLLALKRATQDGLESSIEQGRKNLAMWQNELSKYDKETQPEIWEKVKEHVVEAQEELNGLVEEAAQNTAEILEIAIDKTVQEWKNMMLGGDSEWMETQWELAKRNADQYLDTVEESYEIEKLRSKYNTLANDTADLNLRKRINDQMKQELAYLQEKDKLSEYDVNYANAKLEILQKQIALEDALANKNQMKLRRDSQGNYSYVYTADRDNVENARNELMDSEFNAYEMSKENYLTNYDNYIAAITQAAEQIKAINANTLLSEEEKASRTQEIYDNLKEYLSGVAEQIGVSEKGMLESVKYLAMDSSEIVAQNYADIAAAMEENWTDALSVIGVAVSEEFDHIIHNMDDFLDKTKDKWEEFEDHTEEWAKNVSDIADEGTEGFTDIDDVIIDLNNDMKELNKETESFFDLINNDLGTIDSAVGKLQDYEDQILSLKESSSKLAAELREAQEKVVQKDNELRDWEIKYKQATDPSASSGSGSGEGGAAGISDGIQKGDIVGYNGKYYHDSWGKSPAGHMYSGQAGKVMVDSYSNEKYGGNQTNTGDYGVHISSLTGGDLGWVKESQLFDTGGYTGSWSDGFAGTKNGKMAWLHQKELVLNATDTENILNAVNAMRDVVSMMKTSSLGNFASLGNISNAWNRSTEVQQDISIYADFPAAESAAEIKMALEGLAQQAVQYANKTR